MVKRNKLKVHNSSATALLTVRGCFDALHKLEKTELTQLLVCTFIEARKLESDAHRCRVLLSHPDWSSAKVPTEITSAADYLRLAVRFAVGLTGARARSKANKYYRGMRPYFIRNEPASAVRAALEGMGIERMAREGAHVDAPQPIVVTTPTQEILERFAELPDGQVICLMSTSRQNGSTVVSFDAGSFFPLGADISETKRRLSDG